MKNVNVDTVSDTEDNLNIIEQAITMAIYLDDVSEVYELRKKYMALQNELFELTELTTN